MQRIGTRAQCLSAFLTDIYSDEMWAAAPDEGELYKKYVVPLVEKFKVAQVEAEESGDVVRVEDVRVPVGDRVGDVAKLAAALKSRTGGEGLVIDGKDVIFMSLSTARLALEKEE